MDLGGQCPGMWFLATSEKCENNACLVSTAVLSQAEEGVRLTYLSTVSGWGTKGLGFVGSFKIGKHERAE